MVLHGEGAAGCSAPMGGGALLRAGALCSDQLVSPLLLYVAGVEYSLLKHTAVELDNYLALSSIWVLAIRNCLRAEKMFPLRRLNKEFIDISEDWLKKTLLNKRSFI